MAIDWDKAVLAPTEGVFGEAATYLPAAGGTLPIVGVFDEAYREVDLVDTGVGATSVTPVIGVRLAQFVATPVQGDQVRVPSVGKLYVVREVRPDGHGWAKLMLGYTGQA
ncbi:head-tail joining protein [Dyella lutea]|uniref:Head-tail joining protein n=1 Tax=Dyella lutea TaxID=2950441 RepID=A0ABT1FF83_9GAMM|nr:hypothetical protein [Dyella lutea]MCP1376042.1 hypothetical protein [Dyella lutea]